MIRDPSDGSVKTNSVSDKPNSVSVREKYGENYGMKSLDRAARKPAPAPTAEELRAHYATHNLGFKPKDQDAK